MKRCIPSTGDSILMIGCGNSAFSTDMYLNGGYHNIVNIDYSEIVIEEMKAKTSKTCPDMKWEVGDVTNLDRDKIGM